MKKTILSIALVASLISTLSSCAVSNDRRGRHRDRGHHDRGRGWHRGPYDSNYGRY